MTRRCLCMQTECHDQFFQGEGKLCDDADFKALLFEDFFYFETESALTQARPWNVW